MVKSIGANFLELPLAKVVDVQSPIVYGIVQPGPNLSDGVVFVQSRDVGGKIDLTSLQKTSAEIASRYGRSSLRPGDILFSLRGNIGQCSIAPAGLDGANIARGIARVRVRTGFDNQYVRYRLQAPAVCRKIARNANGSTFRELSIDELRQLCLPFPPLPEQRKIAEILRTWDEAIEKLEELKAANLRLRRGLMWKFVTGTYRFSEFNGHPRREVFLDTLCLINKGQQRSSKHSDKGDYAIINGGISPSGFCDEWNTEAGTITISEGGNSCGYVNLIEDPFWSGGHCYTLEQLKIRRDYLFHFLKLKEREIMRLRVGSGLPNIQKKALASLLVLVPEGNEQIRIEAVANSVRKREMLLELRIQALIHQKRGLMQKLLTGEWRVTP